MPAVQEGARSKPYTISWPLNPVQVQHIEDEFQILFDDMRNGALIIDASQITTGILPAVRGGTGHGVYAVGDLLYASTTTALSRLADIATGNALLSGGVNAAPSWGKVGLTTHVSGTLPIANGGTNATTQTTNGVNYFDGTRITSGSVLSWDGASVLAVTVSGSVATIRASGSGTPAALIQLVDAANVVTWNVENGRTAGRLSFYHNGVQAYVEDGLLASPGGSIAAGTVNSIKGSLTLYGNTSGTVIIRPQSIAGTWNFTLPNSVGTANYVLVTDGVGTATSWVAVGSIAGGAALTRTSDTNVTLTLTGTPATALLQAVDIAAGWSGQLSIARGGTNSGTALSGSTIMISNGSAIVQGAAGTTTTVLHGNAGGAPTYSAVSLTADVTGTLPVGNGGTGTATAFTAGSVVFAGASGIYTQDIGEFTYDSVNNRLFTERMRAFRHFEITTPLATTTRAGLLTTYQVITGAGTSGDVVLFAESGTGQGNLYFMVNGSASAPQTAVITTEMKFGMGTITPNLSGLSATSRVLTMYSETAGDTSALELVGNRNTANASAGQIVFHNIQAAQSDKRIALINGQVGIAGDLDSGSLLFRTASTAGTMTSQMIIDEAGHIGMGTTTPNVTGAGAGRFVLTIQGATNNGQIELSYGGADAATTASVFSTVMPTNTVGPRYAITQLITSAIGSTANDRGGRFRFFTKPDGAFALAEVLNIQSTGSLLALSKFAVGLGADTEPTSDIQFSLAGGSGHKLYLGNGTPYTGSSYAEVLEMKGNVLFASLGSAYNVYFGSGSAGASGGALAFSRKDSTTAVMTLTEAGSDKGNANLNGSLGIGVATGVTVPVSKLTIVYSAFSTVGAWAESDISIFNNGSSGNINQIAMGFYGSTTNAPSAIGFTTTSGAGNTKGALFFATRDVTTDTAPSERMRITSVGDVGIATTDPTFGASFASDTHILGVGGAATAAAASTGTLFLVNNRGTATVGDTAGLLLFGSQNNGTGITTGEIFSALTGAGGAAGFGSDLKFYSKVDNGVLTLGLSIHSNQNITMPAYGAGAATFDASGNITSVSDANLKTNIRPFPYGREALKLIAPKLYQWASHSGYDTIHDYAGFLAQDVATVMPCASFPGPNGYYGNPLFGVVCALVNAVNEMQELLAAQLGDHPPHP